MSLLCSAYDPPRAHLATAVVALDTHQVKVQSVNPTQSALHTAFNLPKGSRLTSLTWFPYGDHHVLALNLTKGSTLIYSPASNEIIAELDTSNNATVLDFHYSPHTTSAWSCDVSGNIYEWDVINFRLIRSVRVSDIIDAVDTVHRILTIIHNNEPHIVLGSHAVHLLDTELKIVRVFPGHVQPVQAIHGVPGDAGLFVTSAKGDRFVNMYSLAAAQARAVFVALANVTGVSVGVHNSKSVLTTLTENGTVEVFNDPTAVTEAPRTHSKKKRRQAGVVSRSSDASLKLTRPEAEIRSATDVSIAVVAAAVLDDSLSIAWLENANVPHFDTIKWAGERGEYALSGENTLVKSRPAVKVASHTDAGHDVAAPKAYSELHTVVNDGTSVGDLEVDEESEPEESLAERLEKLDTKQPVHKPAAKFGKGGTLTTVLAQSLRNNDHSLLESVLGNRDATVVQNTVTKLDPSLAVVLLDRISERMQRQASKFDQLKVWLRWVVIIHGAVLASLPNLSLKLYNLHAVLAKKASSMPRLLELQGRMNILYQQNELRREIVASGAGAVDDDDSDVEYVEEIDDAEAMGLIAEDDEVDDGESDSAMDSEMEFDGHDDFEELDEGDEGNSDIEADK